LGDVQLLQLLASSLHSKPESDSLELKAMVAEVATVVVLGPLVIEVSGGVVSGGGADALTVQLCAAGVASTFPAASLALTENW
jgi:hypothetical protein